MFKFDSKALAKEALSLSKQVAHTHPHVQMPDLGLIVAMAEKGHEITAVGEAVRNVGHVADLAEHVKDIGLRNQLHALQAKHLSAAHELNRIAPLTLRTGNTAIGMGKINPGEIGGKWDFQETYATLARTHPEPPRTSAYKALRDEAMRGFEALPAEHQAAIMRSENFNTALRHQALDPSGIFHGDQETNRAMLDNLVFAIQERAVHLPDKGVALKEAVANTQVSHGSFAATHSPNRPVQGK